MTPAGARGPMTFPNRCVTGIHAELVWALPGSLGVAVDLPRATAGPWVDPPVDMLFDILVI